jgi:poly(3-hydroxybutyrate) depolymerase
MSKNLFSILLFAGLVVNAQTINLRGVVSNSANNPIPNAIVTLVRQKMADTTGTNGKYAFIGTAITTLPAIAPQANDISLNNDVLQFALSSPSPMKVEIFDLNGKLLRQEINMNAAAGTYRFDISKNCQASKVLVIRAAIGISEVSFRYMPLNSGRSSISHLNSSPTISNCSGLTTAAAVVDTIKVTATGFRTKSIAISSMNQELNITLDSNSADGKNEPVPSLGCGKTLGSISKSGTYTISSAGGNRTYIIDIPANYDKDKPYRLIFGMHCMGGSAVKVSGTDDGRDQTAHYYHVKKQALKDNIQCIYVAPQGDEGGTWNPSRDIQFFSDLLTNLKGNLCIDTTRVFCCGFSFGAMYSYALSLAYPKQLRAVACYAPANWNFDQPTNNHIPLAYFQTTGTGDGLCSWINNDSQKKGGKYCVLQHAEDNGCNTNITIQLATSGKHVVTEFEGCNGGYPVRFCSFNGGHQCNASDPGSTTDWIPVETWEFFKRF